MIDPTTRTALREALVALVDTRRRLDQIGGIASGVLRDWTAAADEAAERAENGLRAMLNEKKTETKNRKSEPE